MRVAAFVNRMAREKLERKREGILLLKEKRQKEKKKKRKKGRGKV
jgi:hypothetical protein